MLEINGALFAAAGVYLLLGLGASLLVVGAAAGLRGQLLRWHSALGRERDAGADRERLASSLIERLLADVRQEMADPEIWVIKRGRRSSTRIRAALVQARRAIFKCSAKCLHRELRPLVTLVVYDAPKSKP